MKYVVLGSTGLLGKSLVNVGSNRNLKIIELSRDSKIFPINFLEIPKLLKTLEEIMPKVIINAVGITNMDFCEQNSTRNRLNFSKPKIKISPSSVNRFW